MVRSHDSSRACVRASSRTMSMSVRVMICSSSPKGCLSKIARICRRRAGRHLRRMSSRIGPKRADGVSCHWSSSASWCSRAARRANSIFGKPSARLIFLVKIGAIGKGWQLFPPQQLRDVRLGHLGGVGQFPLAEAELLETLSNREGEVHNLTETDYTRHARD